MAHRAANPAVAQKAEPRPVAAQKTPSQQSAPRGDTTKLAALWSSRRAMSCQLTMHVQQGASKGRVIGSIAWANPSEQDPVGQVSADLQGAMDGQRCLFRLRSVKNALLMETWHPQTQLSKMQQLPSSMVPAQIAGLRELEVPMVQSFLASACPTLFHVPAGQKAMWTLRQASPSRVAWDGPAGATQLLVLDARGSLPKQRVLEFSDASGPKVRWTIDLDCKSAG